MRVQVWVEIPDDCEVTGDATLGSAAWEHAANEKPKHGRMVFSVRIREKWQWPSWLMAAAIVSYGKTWYCCELVPILTKDGVGWLRHDANSRPGAFRLHPSPLH